MTSQLTKDGINFILSAFLLLDPHRNGLTKNDLDHYYLNKILFSNMKTSEANMMTIMHAGIDEIEEFRSYLNLLIKKKYIYSENDYHFINYDHPECSEYLKMYSNILKVFDIKLHEECELGEDIQYEEEALEDDIESEEVYEDGIESEEVYEDGIESEKSIKEAKDLPEFKYLIKSSTNKKIFYKVNEDLTVCTCKAFEFSKENPRSCKHLQFCENSNKSDLPLINSKKKVIPSSLEEPEITPYKYLVKSSTLKKIFYRVNEDFTICTCKAFEFSKENPKTCKHLEYCKNTDKSKLILINDKASIESI